MLSYYHKLPQFLLFSLHRSRLTDLLHFPQPPSHTSSSNLITPITGGGPKRAEQICIVVNCALLKPGGLTAVLLSHNPGRKLAGFTEGHVQM